LINEEHHVFTNNNTLHNNENNSQISEIINLIDSNQFEKIIEKFISLDEKLFYELVMKCSIEQLYKLRDSNEFNCISKEINEIIHIKLKEEMKKELCIKKNIENKSNELEKEVSGETEESEEKEENHLIQSIQQIKEENEDKKENKIII